MYFISPAQALQSPSSTSLQPLDSSRSALSMATPSPRSHASGGSGSSGVGDLTPRPPLCFAHGEADPEEEEKKVADGAFMSPADAVEQEEQRREAQPHAVIPSPLAPSASLGARAAGPPEGQLDAIVPAHPQQRVAAAADGEGAHACCTIM